MTNTLAAPADLAAFPGAPFADALVDAAVAAVRGEAGWHIAPPLTETVTVDSRGGVWLFLPTMYLTAVTEVRDVSGDVAVPITDFRVKRNGMLYRAGGWPAGVSVVEADITHGYTACPGDLFPLIAGQVHRRVRQEAAGSLSVTYEADSSGALGPSSALSRYRLRPAP